MILLIQVKFVQAGDSAIYYAGARGGSIAINTLELMICGASLDVVSGTRSLAHSVAPRFLRSVIWATSTVTNIYVFHFC
jgi:hypothetical protein